MPAVTRGTESRFRPSTARLAARGLGHAETPHLVLSTLDSKGQKRTTILFTGRSTTRIRDAIFLPLQHYESRQPLAAAGRRWRPRASEPPGKWSPRGTAAMFSAPGWGSSVCNVLLLNSVWFYVFQIAAGCSASVQLCFDCGCVCSGNIPCLELLDWSWCLGNIAIIPVIL